MQHTEKMLERDVKFAGRVITVTHDKVLLENGNTSMREIVHHNGGACVLALEEDDTVYLVRQFRYAYGRELLELPAGKLEKGEDPFEAARRELEEEVGVTAESFISLGTVLPTCGYCNEVIHLYAAKGLEKTGQHLDPDEFVTVLKMPLTELEEMIAAGRVNDAKTVIACYRLQLARAKGEF